MTVVICLANLSNQMTIKHNDDPLVRSLVKRQYYRPPFDAYKINADSKPVVAFRRAKGREEYTAETVAQNSDTKIEETRENDEEEDKPNLLQTFVSLISLVDKIKAGIKGLFGAN